MSLQFSYIMCYVHCITESVHAMIEHLKVRKCAVISQILYATERALCGLCSRVEDNLED